MGERLESRFALAITVNRVPAGGGVAEGWVSIVADQGDNVYVQQASTALAGQSTTQPSLIVANNASFLNAQQVDGIDDASKVAPGPVFSDILIYSGTQTSANKTTHVSSGYPFVAAGQSQTQFVLGAYFFSHASIGGEDSPGFDGVVNNGVGGTWSFHRNANSSQIAISAVSAVGPAPVAVSVVVGNSGNFQGISDGLNIVWDTQFVGEGGLSATSPPTITLDVGSNGNHSGYSVGPISASSPSSSRFSLDAATDLGIPAGTAFRIAPGTLTGTLSLEGWANPIVFQPSSPTDSTLVFQTNNDLSPNTGWQTSYLATLRTGATSWVNNENLLIQGSVITDPKSGIPYVVIEGSVGGVSVPLSRATIAMSFAILNSGGDPVACTIAAGQDITRRLTVDLGQAGSTIRVESPVRYATAGLSVGTSFAAPSKHYVSLQASNVLLNAPVVAATSFTASGSASGGALEDLEFNASISAQTYSVSLGDDSNTPLRSRSRLLVSSSGSVSGGSTAGVALNAKSFYAAVANGDIHIEGEVDADFQTWLMQSTEVPLDQLSADPYVFTTTAEVSGANTGIIRGKVAAITLGNDIPSQYSNTYIGGSSLFNIVTLETSLDSLRIRAADAKGNARATPFPYDARINEDASNGDGNIAIDAVAASARPLEFNATNNITFNAALQSASDIIVNSVSGQIIMNAPITTAFGTIQLSANSLTIGNSLQVLDTTSDAFVPDITLEARAGNMVLNGPVTAVGAIRLHQGGAGNVIRGPSRLVADRLEIEAEGSADLTTRVREISGVVAGGITISEEDDLLISDLSAGAKKVSVTVGGYDSYPRNADGTYDTKSSPHAALVATLSDVNELYVSAPNGSLDVHVASTSSIVIGNAAAIQTRTAGYNMQAAGSVEIMSTAAGFTAYDAPLAGGNAFQVQVTSTGNVAGAFSAQRPGVYAATLIGSGALSDSATATALDGVTNLRVGELVLLKDQLFPEQNGVYSVINIGGVGKQWVLARQSFFDTTAEVRLNSWIGSQRGAKNGQRLFQLSSFGDADTPWTSVPCTVSVVTNFGDSTKVRAVSSDVLSADYTYADDGNGTLTRTLTSSSEGPLPTFDGVQLVVGDLVLVRQGNVKDGKINTSSIGVYQVMSLGDSLNAWTLQGVDSFKVGNVIANEGTLRASLTGKAFDVEYDSLNNVGLNIAEVAEGTVTERIGSGDINDSVSFVVSTNLGTNSDCGSLGKMITVLQANSVQVADPTDPSGLTFLPQRQTLGFASSLASTATPKDPTIRLTQSLPKITSKIVLDATAPRAAAFPGTGSPAIVIDGSRILKLENLQNVTTTTEVNGVVVSGDLASASVISGITFAGFSKGAAVVVDGASDVLLSNLRVGVNAAGVKQGNKFGLVLRNNAAGATTLLNSSIVASQQSGVLVSDTSSIRLVGDTIGTAGMGNGVGVNIGGGSVYLGTATPSASIRRLSVTKVATATETNPDSNKFLLPGGFSQLSQLKLGLGVISSRITPPVGKPVAVITSISSPDTTTGAITVAIDGTIEGAGAAMVIDIGVYSQPFADNQASFTLPSGVSVKNVYLGQAVSGPNTALNTTVQSIQADDNGGYTITLSKPLLRGDVQELVFASGGRNQLDANNYGVISSAGMARIYNTTVSNSVFDGVKVEGGQVTIGLGAGENPGVGGRSPSKDRDAAFSNYVYGSGSAGVRLGASVTTASIEIQGNYLGVTAAGSTNVNKAGNIVGNVGVVDSVAYGAVALVVDSRTLQVTLNNHGLVTGAFIWMKIGANATGSAYRVTRLDANTISVQLATTASGTVRPSVGDSVTVSRYGSKTRAAQLAFTGSIDYEGNQHGTPATLPLVAGAPVPVGGGGAGGVAAGRPIVRPITRPRQR